MNWKWWAKPPQKLADLDEMTRRRIDDDSVTPDYGLLLDIRGYLIGDTAMVRWQVIPVESSANINVEDGDHLADILEKVIQILRTGETWTEPDDG